MQNIFCCIRTFVLFPAHGILPVWSLGVKVIVRWCAENGCTSSIWGRGARHGA